MKSIESGKRIRIAACGCGLLDRVFANVDFSGDAFAALASSTPGDGGLVPGQLVFAEELAAFCKAEVSESFSTLAATGNDPGTATIGGPALVAAITAQKLGATTIKTSFYGARGDDLDGRTLSELLTPHNVDLQHHLTLPGATPSTVVLSDPRHDDGCGERCFINSIGAAGAYDAASVPPAFFQADIRLFGATALVPQIHDALDALLLRTPQHGLNVVSTVYDFRNQKRDPVGPWPLVESRAACERVDLLIADAEEARRITGCESLADASARLMDRGIRAIVITNGPNPITIEAAEGSAFGHVGLYRRSVCSMVSQELQQDGGGDTTGCGDNFVGGVLYALAIQLDDTSTDLLDLDAAIRWGAAAGGAGCFDLGGVASGAAAERKVARIRRYAKALIGENPERSKKRMVQFGAGNIGRSLIGDVFSQDYDMQFIEVDEALISALNKEGRYVVTYRDAGFPDRSRMVEGVSAIDARDTDAVLAAVKTADLIGVSVGKAALVHVAKTLAVGLQQRAADAENGAVNVIVAENLQDGGNYLRGLVNAELEKPLSDESVGFVSTCIGRMVPVQEVGTTDAELVRVVAESASDFYGGIDAFLGAPPTVAGFRLVENSMAYVDRKLFLHNMTHSAIAYLASQQLPDAVTIAESVRNSAIRAVVRGAAEEVISGLMLRHPNVFAESELFAYCNGLLERYNNDALGDTIQRVGRDLPRKLGRHERLVGPLCMLVDLGLPYDHLLEVINATLFFPDPLTDGKRLIDDGNLNLSEFCGLRKSSEVEVQASAKLNGLVVAARRR